MACGAKIIDWSKENLMSAEQLSDLDCDRIFSEPAMLQDAVLGPWIKTLDQKMYSYVFISENLIKASLSICKDFGFVQVLIEC